MMLPETDRHLYSKKYVLAMLQVSLGGRVAEEVACGDISSGASDDIKRASSLARTMVCEWGMSEEIGPVRLGSENSSLWPDMSPAKEYSDQTAEVVDREVKRLVQTAYEKVRMLLSEYRVQLDNLAAALLKYETLEAEEVRRILKGEILQKPTVNELLDNVAQKVTDTVNLTSTEINKAE
jgi:cell division protease FtsH